MIAVLKGPVEGRGRFARQLHGRPHFADIVLQLIPAASDDINIRNHSALAMVQDYFHAISDALRVLSGSMPFRIYCDVVLTGGIELLSDASELAYREAAVAAFQDAVEKGMKSGQIVLKEDE